MAAQDRNAWPSLTAMPCLWSNSAGFSSRHTKRKVNEGKKRYCIGTRHRFFLYVGIKYTCQVPVLEVGNLVVMLGPCQRSKWVVAHAMRLSRTRNPTGGSLFQIPVEQNHEGGPYSALQLRSNVRVLGHETGSCLGSTGSHMLPLHSTSSPK